MSFIKGFQKIAISYEYYSRALSSALSTSGLHSVTQRLRKSSVRNQLRNFELMAAPPKSSGPRALAAYYKKDIRDRVRNKVHSVRVTKGLDKAKTIRLDRESQGK